MTDLRTRFRAADEVEMPALWEEVLRRVERPDGASSPPPAPRRRTAMAVAVALLASALAGAFLWTAFRPGQSPERRPGSPAPSTVASSPPANATDGPSPTPLELEEPVPLTFLAIRPNDPSFAVIDLLAGTRTVYEPGQHAMPLDAVDGAIVTPAGHVVVWQDGTARVFLDRLDDLWREIRPHPLRRIPGVAPALRVVPTLDGGGIWLVQPGMGCCGRSDPTLVELVDLEVDRMLLKVAVEPNSLPVGATGEGLVLNAESFVETPGGWVTEPGSEHILHVTSDGAIQQVARGRAIAAGPASVVRLVCASPDRACDLHLTDIATGRERVVDPPADGEWLSVAGPGIPSDTQPLQVVSPDGTRVLVGIGREIDVNGVPAEVDLAVVDLETGSASVLRTMDELPQATWSRDGRWIAAIERPNVLLLSIEDGRSVPLADVIPKEHFVFAAG
jgi:hypothetical protein